MKKKEMNYIQFKKKTEMLKQVYRNVHLELKNVCLVFQDVGLFEMNCFFICNQC